MNVFRSSWSFALGLTTLLFGTVTLGASAEPDTRPNILWIITDDHRSDSLTVYNQATRGTAESQLGYVESPRTDALAAEGTLFINAYCNSPACAPSRAAMHVGRYPHRSGIYGFRRAHLDSDVSSTLVQGVMKDHGYQPAHFGKSGVRIFPFEWINQWRPPGYYNPRVTKRSLHESDGADFWFNSPWGQHEGKGMVMGTEQVFRFPDGRVERFWMNRVDREITDEEKAHRAAVEEELDILRTYTRSNPDLIIAGVSSNTTWNTMDAATVKAMQRYLDHEGKGYTLVDGKTKATGPDPDQPVFIHLGFSAPHTPVLPSKEFRDRFVDRTYAVPAFDEKELELLPETMRQLHNDMNFSRMTDDEKQQAIRDYYALCAMLDFLVGEAADAFKAYSEKHGRPWVILYVVGDHGWHLGEQGIEAKFGPWFESNHGSVVAVSSDPTLFPAGKVYDGFVEYVDFVPTFYDLSGIAKQDFPELDGISLLETIGDDPPRRDYVIGEFNQVRGERAYLRTDDFAFSMRCRPYHTKPGEGYEPGERIMWGLKAPAEDVQMTLYDLRVDPLERVNVAYYEPYEALAALLRTKLATIILGDGRVEADWREINKYHISDFAPGAHDRKLVFPDGVVPPPSLPAGYADLVSTGVAP
ncbi:MAG: sulfatase-like hydrolase/transferase [Planctomycetota bacterium]